ncbi:PREDICTED: transcription factor JUNGBRUNNEN 1-like [Ipomoea nil]|uniref:transcription factor JUNGBRUNNEN 1-like n=1 Tax=Ipomoea nil TaxID=35883 RepID=UPI00090096D9|nr:PREDICTED: transcription factor JUNGBRUNNEN 1-like [Ipomoea nil]
MENLASDKHNQKHDDDDDDMFLPGFRFHPTDEELVGFYLLRKVQNRLLPLDFIKQIDIYKFDPWDLPKTASSVGENEWYFFCKRGRKYKNSIRPNRVTGSGFWKATGIDREIHAAAAGRRHCIGLKKSLVYYRGSAGKGTKTEWMMHEFRLPPQHHKSSSAAIPTHPKNIAQEAEVWTLCRILKRKSMSEWKELTAAKRNSTNPSAETCSNESPGGNQLLQENYISFSNPLNDVNLTKHNHEARRPFGGISVNVDNPNDNNVDYHIIYGSHQQQLLRGQQINNNNHVSQSPYPLPPAANSLLSSFTSATPEIINGFPKHADWEELRSVILGFSTHP